MPVRDSTEDMQAYARAAVELDRKLEAEHHIRVSPEEETLVQEALSASTDAGRAQGRRALSVASR